MPFYLIYIREGKKRSSLVSKNILFTSVDNTSEPESTQHTHTQIHRRKGKKERWIEGRQTDGVAPEDLMKDEEGREEGRRKEKGREGRKLLLDM